jgi:septal ring factor EnvC (AmiA/AmiB activator)
VYASYSRTHCLACSTDALACHSSYLASTLDDYDEEMKAQRAEMARLQEKSANHDKEVAKYKRTADINERRANELEAATDKMKKEVDALKV